MGIKIFLSSFDQTTLREYKALNPDSEMNILLSYGTRSPDYYDMIDTNRDETDGLILDSGAYTANFASANTYPKIDLDGFISYCKKPTVNQSFDFIFNYDEDFNLDGFETNFRNMRIIEDNGIDVVPVAHDYTGEYFDEIGFYLQSGYKLIALGFSVHKQRDKKNNITNAVYRIYYSGARVHLLGISSYDILADIPVHYCDSSSWAQEGRFGNIIWWNPHMTGQNKTDRIRFLDKEDSHDRHAHHIGNYKHLDELEFYLKDQLDMTIADLCGHKKDFNRQLVNVHFFVQLQDRVREAHEQRGFIIK